MVTCPNEVANQLKVVQHLLQLEIQAEISNPEHAPISHRINSAQDNSNNFLENEFNLFVSTSLSLCMSQFLPKSLNGSTGSWTIENLNYWWAKEKNSQNKYNFRNIHWNIQVVLGFLVKLWNWFLSSWVKPKLVPVWVSFVWNPNFNHDFNPSKIWNIPGSSLGFRRVNRFFLLVLRACQKWFSWTRAGTKICNIGRENSLKLLKRQI